MSISLDLLRSFLAVHRRGSITAAADQLGLAQPTVTAQVKSLETQLGQALFDRQPRGVVPTSAADELARRVAEPLDALDALLLSEPSSAYPTTVRLGGPAEFVCEKALPILAAMVADGLQLRVRLGLPDPLLDDLVDGRLDLAITGVRPRRRGVVATPIYDEEFVLVAAPLWAERIPVPATAEALRAVPLVAYGEEAPLLRRYWRSVFEVRLARPADVVVPDLRGVQAAVVGGAGVTVLPKYLCATAIDAGRLRSIAEPDVPPLNTLYLAHGPATLARRSVAAVYRQLLGLRAGSTSPGDSPPGP